MIIKKLRDHQYSQCHVEIMDNGDIWFVSYKTPIVKIDAEGWLSVGSYVTCSATTRKQVGWFMNEYAPAYSYHTCKYLLQAGHDLNMLTGEIR